MSLEVSSPILPDPNGRIYDDEQVHRATVLQDGSVHLLRGKFLIRRCNITMLPKEEEKKKN